MFKSMDAAAEIKVQLKELSNAFRLNRFLRNAKGRLQNSVVNGLPLDGKFDSHIPFVKEKIDDM